LKYKIKETRSISFKNRTGS